MPAITVGDRFVLPRIPLPDPAASRVQSVAKVMTAHRQAEGAAGRQAGPLGAQLLGGPVTEAPIAHYGPFVMNAREEIMRSVKDYEGGGLGVVPADQLPLRNHG